MKMTDGTIATPRYGEYRLISAEPRRIGDDALIETGGKVRHVRLLEGEYGKKWLVEQFGRVYQDSRKVKFMS